MIWLCSMSSSGIRGLFALGDQIEGFGQLELALARLYRRGVAQIGAGALNLVAEY
jgi:hypothetical protein